MAVAVVCPSGLHYSIISKLTIRIAMNKHHTLLTDELKERIDIVEVISAYLPLKRNGTGYKSSCPFHDDKDLSLDIFPEKTYLHT